MSLAGVLEKVSQPHSRQKVRIHHRKKKWTGKRSILAWSAKLQWQDFGGNLFRWTPL
jgi:hypothetical protein